MPELPEVETVRRNLEATVLGRTIDQVRLSGKKLRSAVSPRIRTALRERRVESVARHGKYLLLRLDAGTSLISHLGMSGRWLFFADAPVRAMPHVHVRIRFRDGAELWFQDPRRFGLLKLVPTARLREDPALAGLGPDPIATPPSGASLEAVARRATIAVKSFLLDQKRLAGVGNIYASEILHRAGVDPRRAAGKLRRHEWDAVARETVQVLNEAIERMGTTFSAYRTLWNEPGSYGEQLLVYDREGRPCRSCGRAIRRIVQGQRSTFYCPHCQRGSGRSSRRPSAFSIAADRSGA
jgi:formamidopyrimidine-DNA glycosylase